MEFSSAIEEYAKKIESNLDRVNQLVEDLEDKKWLDLPDEFKIFAFNFCIIEGSSYQQ